MANFQATDSNPWNPFEPTKKDLERTEKLAKKNPTVAGILGFLFPLAAMIYLNRGVNTLKILGYVFIAGFIIGFTMSESSEEDIDVMCNVVGLSGTVAIAAEHFMAVEKARQRSITHDEKE